jgi:hypothetical protein
LPAANRIKYSDREQVKTELFTITRDKERKQAQLFVLFFLLIEKIIYGKDNIKQPIVK